METQTNKLYHAIQAVFQVGKQLVVMTIKFPQPLTQEQLPTIEWNTTPKEGTLEYKEFKS